MRRAVSSPQARDIFDLHLLLARLEPSALRPRAVLKRQLLEAIEHAMSISFDEYTSKVVAYLDADQALLYQSHEAWDAMQVAVVSHLQSLQ